MRWLSPGPDDGSDSPRSSMKVVFRRKGGTPSGRILIKEINLPPRPPVHERRIVSSGTILDPLSPPASWSSGTQLDISLQRLDQQPLPAARRFADGLSSWLLRRSDGTTEWMVLDRPAGSERDLVVLAAVL